MRLSATLRYLFLIMARRRAGHPAEPCGVLRLCARFLAASSSARISYLGGPPPRSARSAAGGHASRAGHDKYWATRFARSAPRHSRPDLRLQPPRNVVGDVFLPTCRMFLPTPPSSLATAAPAGERAGR